MKRSKFSLSNYKLLTCDQGEFVPCGMTEVLPGDSIQQTTSALIRVSPLMAPVMHPVHAQIRHFFVPHRLVWEEWEDFITGGPDGLNASVFPKITFPQNGPEIGTLADYLGVPTDNTHASGTEVSALPFRAYALIWNEFIRDQDLQTKLTIDLTSGPDTTTNTTLQNVTWEKDYYTSSRPWTQKGPDVNVPLGAAATVKTDGTRLITGAMSPLVMADEDGNLPGSSRHLGTTVTTGVVGRGAEAYTAAANMAPVNLYADLSTATSANINELRLAFALQRYEEARARYGSRYTEYLRYLGVRSSDARLQRPEYLGGGKQTIQFSEVLQTGVTTDGDDTDGVGNLKGHGIGALRSNRYRRYFEEHGTVLTFVSVKPKTMYAQGLARMWSRSTKEDFFQKELQHIGQQEVYNREIYTSHTTPSGVFGYQNRYDEYRQTESSIAGLFKSTLDFWHMARIFTSNPALNAAFVAASPTKRIQADQVSDSLLIMANHSIQARRLVDRTGTPSGL